MPRPKTGATNYHAKLGLTDKDRAANGLVVCNSLYVSAEGPTVKFRKSTQIMKCQFSTGSFVNMIYRLTDVQT